MRIPAGLILLLLVGCASTPTKYRNAADDLADDLVDQLEKRVDPRHVRVLVYEFESSSGNAGDSRFVRHSKGLSDRELGWQIKHQMTAALAQQVVVIETNSRDLAVARAVSSGQTPNLYQQAIDLGANVVIVGNFTVVEGEDVLLMARAIDAETQQVLATSEDLVRDVEVPVRPGW
mgnify:CR=1 FL=1